MQTNLSIVSKSSKEFENANVLNTEMSKLQIGAHNDYLLKIHCSVIAVIIYAPGGTRFFFWMGGPNGCLCRESESLNFVYYNSDVNYFMGRRPHICLHLTPPMALGNIFNNNIFNKTSISLK